MNRILSTRQVTGPALFLFAGLMFLVYPSLRPYSDETSMAGAHAFASDRWVAAHVCAMLGFIAIALALRELQAHFISTGVISTGVISTGVISTGAERPVRIAVVTAWIGIGLTLPYYGAEAFALHAIGQRAVAVGNPDLLTLADPIRYSIVSATMFGVGLILLAVGAVATAVAVSRATQSRLLGAPFAVAFVLFIPQFYFDPALRVAHGVLVLVGCVAMASAFGQLTSKPAQLSSTTTGA